MEYHRVDALARGPGDYDVMHCSTLDRGTIPHYGNHFTKDKLCRSTLNWRAKTPLSYRIFVELISTTSFGLAVTYERDQAKYQKGIVVSDQDLQVFCT